MEGSGRDLCQHLPKHTKEIDEKPQARQPISDL